MEDFHRVELFVEDSVNGAHHLTSGMTIFHTLALLVPMIIWIVTVYFVAQKAVAIRMPERKTRHGHAKRAYHLKKAA